VVSFRVGQVTFSPSARTSCRNLNGLIFGMALDQIGIPSPTFKDETDRGILLGEMFVAEIRRRAADDGRFLTAGWRERQET
jgi:hypothetical protein